MIEIRSRPGTGDNADRGDAAGEMGDEPGEMGDALKAVPLGKGALQVSTGKYAGHSGALLNDHTVNAGAPTLPGSSGSVTLTPVATAAGSLEWC